MKISKRTILIEKTCSTLNMLGFKLKSYQKSGLEWMIQREKSDNIKGGILADDPGLGKTVQMLATMLANPCKKTLIIMPPSIIVQWKLAISKILPKAVVYVHHGLVKNKNIDFEICITTYGQYLNNTSKDTSNGIKLHDILWDRVILDEGHLIRNKNTKIFNVCKLFNENCIKWVLTGTPIQNSNKDILTLLNFIGIIDYENDIQFYILKYVLRRTKNILEKDNTLQKIVIYNHCITFQTKAEQDIYSCIQNNEMDNIMISEAEGESRLNLNILESLLRLRQCCIHPSIAINSMKKKYKKLENKNLYSYPKHSTKINTIVKHIKLTKNNCLVFSHFKEEMRLIKKELKIKGIFSKIYDGSLTQKQRNYVLDSFNNDPVQKYKLMSSCNKYVIKENKYRVLIIQIKAGGVGLNLQKFSDVFITSPDWNPSNEIQAICRAHRIGQNNRVKVHKYTLRYNPSYIVNSRNMNTIDERILNKQVTKRNTMVSILEDETLLFNENFDTNEEDMYNLLGL